MSASGSYVRRMGDVLRLATISTLAAVALVGCTPVHDGRLTIGKSDASEIEVTLVSCGGSPARRVAAVADDGGWDDAFVEWELPPESTVLSWPWAGGNGVEVVRGGEVVPSTWFELRGESERDWLGDAAIAWGPRVRGSRFGALENGQVFTSGGLPIKKETFIDVACR